jgi:TPP-dependent pyruvate/acetoin dehydrogenase alpha subunit
MLYRIRRVEEEVARVYPTDKVMSPVHLSIGQEALSVAVCQALAPHDIVFGSYRCHALYLAKGGDLKKMIAELYGKATGCAKGKAGSMHMIDVSAGVMGASAVVSTTIPLATGYAMAMRMQKRNVVVTSFFGDGAVEEGAFHESMNFASLKQLPIVYVCENNAYAIHSRLGDRQGIKSIWELAKAYGIPAERLDSRDMPQVTASVSRAVEQIRQGQSGPRFFEIDCYRWMEHVGPNTDFHLGYRQQQECAAWVENDPMLVIGRRLPPAVKARIDAEEEATIREAFEFAENSPFPHESELYTDMPEEA